MAVRGLRPGHRAWTLNRHAGNLRLEVGAAVRPNTPTDGVWPPTTSRALGSPAPAFNDNYFC